MNSDQILYLLEMAHRDGSVDELRWRFPDVDWAAAELELDAVCAATAPPDTTEPTSIQAQANQILKAIYEPSLKDMLTGDSYGMSYNFIVNIGTSTSTEGTYTNIVRSTEPMWRSTK